MKRNYSGKGRYIGCFAGPIVFTVVMFILGWNDANTIIGVVMGLPFSPIFGIIFGEFFDRLLSVKRK